MPPRRFALITGCNNEYQSILDISLPGKREYCKRHGYDIIVVKNRFNKANSRLTWEKIPTILKHLKRYEWIFWSDADSIIMNHDIRLENLVDDTCIMVASTMKLDGKKPYFHFGNILLKNSPFCELILTKTYSYKRKWRVDPLEEESAFYHMIWRKMPMIQRLIKTEDWSTFFSLPREYPIEEHTIDNPRQYTHQPGHFIVHIPSPLSIDKRVSLMEKQLILSPSVA